MWEGGSPFWTNLVFAQPIVQIIAANYWIMSECEDLRNNSCLFWLQQHKTMRLDEFEQIQIQHINHVHQDLKDGWVTSLKKFVLPSSTPLHCML